MQKLLPWLILFCTCAGIWQVGVWLGWLTDWLYGKLKPKPPEIEYLDAVDIINYDMVEHRLEGPIAKRLVIYPAKVHAGNTIEGKQRIVGPILEFNGTEILKHKAEDVVEDMLIEYALSRQLGVNMTREQAMVCVRNYFQIEVRRVPKEE